MSRLVLRRAVLAFHLPALAILPWVSGMRAWAAPPAEETIFQSSELRIYRTLNRDGTPVVVLTNVDAEGRYFPGRPAEAAARHASPSAVPPDAPERSSARPVTVVVNHGDVGSPDATEETEVASDAGGGTTVIINIRPPEAPHRETVVVPVAYAPVAYGGLVGPYRYPDRQYFLGYAPGTSSPSFFGGLGLNAGNRFGLKTGDACDRGYDCMFGPTGNHP